MLESGEKPSGEITKTELTDMSDGGRFDKSKARVRRGAKLTAIGVLLGGVLLVVAMLFDRWNDTRDVLPVVTRTAADPSSVDYHRNITQIEPPKEMSVFNEVIPLDIWEVRERFERELFYNYQNADQLVMWYKRSARYFPMIDKKLAEAGLPRDLRYLAVAESGLRNVKSPAQANGFWQFIPGTAARFGLRVDETIDERQDPVKATDAAIKYLSRMKSEFPSWALVAAGYNMGEENVRQVMDWQHTTNYWNMYINEETMRYVLRIAAIKELMEHGDKYGLDFNHVKPFHTPQVQTVHVDGPVSSLSDWATQKGFFYKDLKVLNPWIAGRSLPSGSWNLALPAGENDRVSLK